MACTTILVGKKASYDGSTMISRNDDSPSGVFHVKKMALTKGSEINRKYKSVISKVEITLPEKGYTYTSMPNVDKSEGIWGAAGFNELNVSMTATETITSNERVLGADPLIDLKDKSNLGKKGIGEEDFVSLVLPFIKSAKEGVIRLGNLLEEYGTYESNGIAFSDENEIWWLETIGGHHFIAKRVPDDKVVIMPNQFGLDEFDFDDAYGSKQNHMCSKDLKEFVIKNHLCLNTDSKFNPRIAFGSHSDSDHVYNTPRAWYMGRYLNHKDYTWDGENAQFKPTSDDIPWCIKPTNLVTIEDIKYLQSSYYQNTPYNPYNKKDIPTKGIFRPIGISRTAFFSINQIRPYVKDELKPVFWFSFGSNAFNAVVPLYAHTNKIPSYYANTTLTVDSNTFYWANRLIAAMADANFNTSMVHVERYQLKLQSKAHELLNKYDNLENINNDILTKANEEMASIAKELTLDTLNNVLYDASCHMKNGFSKSDN